MMLNSYFYTTSDYQLTVDNINSPRLSVSGSGLSFKVSVQTKQAVLLITDARVTKVKS